MSEFGHVGIIGGGFCIDSWGVGPFVIATAGKSFRFEDSDRFGPALINANGDLKANPYPPERSPFWKAHFAWVKQGRRTESDGSTCIWDELKPTKYRKVGRQLFVVEEGDPDGGYVEVKSGPVS